MGTDVKATVVMSLQQYVKQHNLTQEEIAKRSGVNISYINAMMNNRIEVGNTKIRDAHFRKVAKAIGFKYENYYWEHIDTPQFVQITDELLDAKVNNVNKLITCETGMGKTYTVKQFSLHKPVHTYPVTVGALHTLHDILDDIAAQIRVQSKGRTIFKLQRIAAKLRQIHLEGGRPIIIIDEAENLGFYALKMVKSLYDALEGYCPLVLIGTRQLKRKLERLVEKDEEGMAQLYRRFKAGMREIRELDKETMYAPFLEKVEDINVQTLVTSLANNYGELHDFLEPALRESDNQQEPLTEEFYKVLYKGII
ncbi:MAG: AAA family ATPase [Bacteroidales bacterium]